ncbi:MAG: phasin family protein [Hyphomicrobiales bacterium]|nr:phasin family protein [Hyphomicrobiales bacterium]
MSDDDDVNTNLTPLSSNSYGSSGTRAWSVSVAEEPANQQPEPDAFNAAEPSDSASTSMNDTAQIEQDEAVDEAIEPPATETGEDFASPASPISYDDPVVQATPSEDVDLELETAEIATVDEPVTQFAPDLQPSDPPDENISEAAEPNAEDTTSGAQTGVNQSEPTTEELRQAVLNSMAEQETRQAEAFALFENVSENFTSMLATARNDVAMFSFKLMEFAHANAQNNFELAKACGSARSLPDIVNVQANYLKRQVELLNAQARELQALTSEITAKNAMEIQSKRNSV